MIVIASHNNINNLNRILKSIHDYNMGFFETVLIVNTNSDNQEYLTYLKELTYGKYNFNFIVDKTDYSGYDTGAYLYAYEKYYDNKYIFLQDSLEIKSWNVYYEISKKLQYNDVVAWRLFDKSICPFDSNAQRNWLLDNIKSDDYDRGIFGPIFSINRNAMDLIKENNLCVIPSSKMQQQGMERGWSIIFKKLNLKVDSLEDWGWKDNTNTRHFNKYFFERT